MSFYRKRRKKNKALIKLYNDVSDLAGIHRNTTRAVIEALWPVLRDAIVNGYEVTIPGFGQFQQKISAEKITVNVNDTSKRCYTPESTQLRFEAEKNWSQEQRVVNAVIPPPDEYKKRVGVPISYRYYDVIRQRYGDEILETVYKANTKKP